MDRVLPGRATGSPTPSGPLMPALRWAPGEALADGGEQDGRAVRRAKRRTRENKSYLENESYLDEVRAWLFRLGPPERPSSKVFTQPLGRFDVGQDAQDITGFEHRLRFGEVQVVSPLD